MWNRPPIGPTTMKRRDFIYFLSRRMRLGSWQNPVVGQGDTVHLASYAPTIAVILTRSAKTFVRCFWYQRLAHRHHYCTEIFRTFNYFQREISASPQPSHSRTSRMNGVTATTQPRMRGQRARRSV